MTPSHHLRLQSMLRAMVEVVVPAIDPKQQLAKDQASIVIGNLKILMDQSDRVYDFLLVELHEYARLVREFVPLVAEGAARARALEALSEAEPVIAAPIPKEVGLREMVAGMKTTAGSLLDEILEAGGRDERAAAVSLVLRQSEKQILRERAWLRSSGFDPEHGQLPPIDELLDPRAGFPD
jgi:hypothetical protein